MSFNVAPPYEHLLSICDIWVSSLIRRFPLLLPLSGVRGHGYNAKKPMTAPVNKRSEHARLLLLTAVAEAAAEAR
jgi:hypothetical protein